MASIIGVQELQHTNGTSAMTIASNGLVKHPQRPIFSVRGVASGTSLTAAETNFDYVTSWTTTDVDVGNLLNAGGYAEVPTGFGGIYQITYVINRVTTTDYNNAIMYAYNGSSYTKLMQHFAFNDYDKYSTGTTLFYSLSEGDRIYVGWNDAYGVPGTEDFYSNFSMMFVG
jgi:hypothetical protein